KKLTSIPNGLAIGMAWHIARDKTTRWHSGMTGGYATWLAVVPGKKIGTIVMANTAAGQVSAVGEQITRVALGIKEKPLKFHRSIEVDAKTLETYVGDYELSPEFILHVTREDGSLFVQATGQNKFRIFAESKTRFFYKVVDAQITFEPDDQGKVSKLVLHQNGKDMPGTRVDN
ncbi:MAG TPA: DUF3471 domain-containing protein, partial [Pirellulales bacterium]|nr:DUF3471 domain-containing protein [Pirellulales bacterium]